MTARSLDGKACASSVEVALHDRIVALKDHGITPHLAVVIVGNDPASHVYVNSKIRTCERLVGLSISQTLACHFPTTIHPVKYHLPRREEQSFS